MSPLERSQIHAAMVRFAEGERAAFEEVFDGLWPLLRAIAERALATSSPGEAEDAAQRALLRVFSRIADLDRGRDGVAWAAGIVGYEVLTLRRQAWRRREAPADGLVALADSAPLADEGVVRRELHAALAAALGALGERDREALRPLLEDASAPSGETARKRRFRAVQRLRAVWRSRDA